MRYIERKAGNIVADYANLQPGLTEEQIDEDVPEFVAYRTISPPSPAEIIDRRMADDPAYAVLVDRIAADAGLPRATLIADLKTRMST